MDTNKTVPTTGIRTETKKDPIALSRIFSGDFEKKDKSGKEITKTAELRQVITTKSFYPSKKVESNLQNGLFSIDKFDIEEQVFDSVEQRVTWIPVPVNATEELVKKALETDIANGATLYKVLSNKPILDENQEQAIKLGFRTYDDFANSQAVRFPETHETTPNELILDKNGNVQYRRVFYWKTPHEDVDLRDTSKVYVTTEMEVELHGASVLEGQKING